MKYLVVVFICLYLGCSSGVNKIQVHISLQNNGALKITGPDAATLGEIQRDSGAWQIVLPVYRMPADTDMKDFQPVQPGKYALEGDVVTFTPDTPFAAGKTYFLRWRNFAGNKTAWDIVKNHQKITAATYTDLTFKK